MTDPASMSMEVPNLLSGVRVDRGVAMMADVSRAVAAQLIADGRVLVDGVAVTVGRTFHEGGFHVDRAPARTGGGPGRAGGGRGVPGGATPTPRWRWWTSRPGWWSIPAPGTMRARWWEDCCRGSRTWPTWWRPGCARRTGRALCTGSTRGPLGFWPWPAPRRPTRRWWGNWPSAPWSAVTWRWSKVMWPTSAARSTRPSAARPARPPKWPLRPAGNRLAPATRCVSGAAGHLRPRCSSWRCKAAEPIRSASTWRLSATRWWVTPVTGRPTRSWAQAASSCTPTVWPSPPGHR